MWKPAESLNWQKNALCAKPKNRKYLDWFFSKDFSKKYAAKNLCFICPVRSECLQWALEHKQIWGIWGGKDEIDIRPENIPYSEYLECVKGLANAIWSLNNDYFPNIKRNIMHQASANGVLHLYKRLSQSIHCSSASLGCISLIKLL